MVRLVAELFIRRLKLSRQEIFPPKRTGLPMVVWISEKGKARHDVRVKVSSKVGNKLSSDDLKIVIGVRPEPHLINGDLDKQYLEQVFTWINLNKPVIIDYWDGKIDTGDALESIKSIADPVDNL